MNEQGSSNLPVHVPRPAPPVAGDAGAAGGVPFGVGSEAGVGAVLRALWSLRAQPRYAARLLTQSVGDGCGLGSWGMDHPVLPGRHLCGNRVARIREELADGLVLADVLNIDRLRKRSPEALKALGRLPFPMVRRRGERGFSRVSWDHALRLAGGKLAHTPGDRQGWLVGSDRLTNEAAFSLARAAELAGAPAPALVGGAVSAATRAGLSLGLGVRAATGTYSDVLKADLVLLCGVDPARNHPSLLRLLHHAKAEGARVVAVNPVREPGLDKAWMTDEAGLAVWGTRLTDDFVGVRPGGDAALFNALLLLLAGWGALDPGLEARTEGWAAWLASLEAVGVEGWLARAGVGAQEAEWLARLVSRAENLVTIYSGGFADPAWGEASVASVANLHLARAALSRPGCAILPLMERLSIAGAVDFGVTPGPRQPGEHGLAAHGQIAAVAAGEVDLWYLAGIDPLAELPDLTQVRAALSACPVRIHQGWWLDPSMLAEPAELTVILPARLRHEQLGGTTSTSSDRVVRHSPRVMGGPRLQEARSDWAIPLLLSEVAGFDPPPDDVAELRELMAEAVPRYDKLKRVAEGASWFRIGGQHLTLAQTPRFMPADVTPPAIEADGELLLSARRPAIAGGDSALLLNPEDARARRLSDGQCVTVRSALGAVEAVVRFAEIRPGTAQLERPASSAVMDGYGCRAITLST